MKEEENKKDKKTKMKQQDSGLGEITEEGISECRVPVKQATASLILVKTILW